ncbi:MAG: LysR family transcriptional regulator [Rhodospirillales bacterium]|jgi:DNA-binding transcriptional LysR family regulator
MNIKRLQALRAVIELSSITEAAHAMNLTQSGVSRLIGLLEDEVGFLLFNRIKGRLQITGRGEAFFKEVEPLLTGIDQIPSVANEIRQHRLSRFRLITLNSQAHSLVPLALERFTKTHPNTAISITILSRRELSHWAGGEHFDLALASLPIEQRLFEQETFIRFPVVVALPSGHPLCLKKSIKVIDLKDENLISLDPFAIFQPGVKSLFQEQGIEPTTKIQTTSMLQAGQMVACGLGIAIVDPFIAHSLKSDKIEIRKLVPDLEYEYGYIWPVGRKLSPLAENFASAITEVAQELTAPWLRRRAQSGLSPLATE